MNTNSENPHVGRGFQDKVQKIAEDVFKQVFVPEKPVAIGKPPKEHRFDLVSEDGKIIIECKCYTWTKAGFVPSAKLATLDEAVLYMRNVPYDARKIIIMHRAVHEKRNITLAEYFVDKKSHLLGDVEVAEVSETDKLRFVTQCNEDTVYIPEIDTEAVIAKLKVRRKAMKSYTEIMELSVTPLDPEFQRKYDAFYRVRRNEEWRKEYFRLMDVFHKRKTTAFGEILLRLYQTTGQIEASFASKMLATLDADMPIWDSNVLQVLKYKLSGKTPELKMSNAVVLYDKICSWYKTYLRTDHAKTLIDRFDAEFPEFITMNPTKKIDFILWAAA